MPLPSFSRDSKLKNHRLIRNRSTPRFTTVMARSLGCLSLALCSLASTSVQADIRLPHLFGDNMVLQRDEPNTIWGWAEPGEELRLRMDDIALEAKANEQGLWSFNLPAFPAGGAFLMSFSSQSPSGDHAQIDLHNVTFGDVWLASGQSNMQLPMYRVAERFPDAIGQAKDQDIRQFTVGRTLGFDGPQQDVSSGQWEASVAPALEQQSAVAYFFAKALKQEVGVPIGILSANFGGSPAECWMSEQALQRYPKIHQLVQSYKAEGYIDKLKSEDQAYQNQWHGNVQASDKGLKAKPTWTELSEFDEWPSINVPGDWQQQGIELKAGVVWFKKHIHLNQAQAQQPAMLRLGTLVDADWAYINGVQVGSTGYQYPPRRYKLEKGILKAGDNVITLRIRADGNGGAFVKEMPYFLQVGDEQLSLAGQWHYQVGMVTDANEGYQFVPWNQPLGCYNDMLAPLLKTKITGVIWYQGESNADRPAQYRVLFPHLIRHWRQAFAQGPLPFIFVQLANYMPAADEPGESGWADLRFAQSLALELKNTAMASAADVGNWNDLHPMDKKTVGERLALAARAIAYKEKGLSYSGPIFLEAKRKKSEVELRFKHVSDGLMVKGDSLEGFELADAQGKFHWAKAKIKHNKVVVWHEDISKPTAIRYAWANNPEQANLYNKAGLPASVFEYYFDH